MTPDPSRNPFVRLVVAVFLIAVGVRVTIEILRPVLPALIGIAIACAVVYVAHAIGRNRDRW